MTDDCPIPFSTKATLLPDAPPCGFFWSYDDPDLGLCLTFFEDMDTSVKPPAAFFDIDVDTVNKTPDSLTWLNDRVLSFDYAEAILNPSVLRLIYPLPHPLLRTALLVVQGSFNIGGTEFVPTAAYDYNDPDLLVVVEFPIDMDQTKTPNTNEMIIYDNGVPKEPDSISWTGPRHLELDYTEAGLTEDVDVELPTPTPNLVCLTGRQVCPFRVDELGPT